MDTWIAASRVTSHQIVEDQDEEVEEVCRLKRSTSTRRHPKKKNRPQSFVEVPVPGKMTISKSSNDLNALNDAAAKEDETQKPLTNSLFGFFKRNKRRSRKMGKKMSTAKKAPEESADVNKSPLAESVGKASPAAAALPRHSKSFKHTKTGLQEMLFRQDDSRGIAVKKHSSDESTKMNLTMNLSYIDAIRQWRRKCESVKPEGVSQYYSVSRNGIHLNHQPFYLPPI